MQSPYLGLTSGSTIYIDAHGGKHGWFVDPTPGDDAEFGNRIGPFELAAGLGNPGYGRFDLLTVVMHEVGYLLGFSDVAPGVMPDDIMTDVPAAGVRCLKLWRTAHNKNCAQRRKARQGISTSLLGANVRQ